MNFKLAVLSVVAGGSLLSASAEGLNDYLFRYDFTSGSKVYSHNGHETEPTAEWSGFTAVNGPSGYGTAVHPCGVGTITGGETILNEGDWSVAMCVKPGMTDRGVFLSIGSGRCQQNSRDLCFLSSSTAGKIVLSSRQTWGGQYYNEPSVFEVTGLGDTANTFHTIVATCSAYNKEKDCATVTVYVDGVLKGTFDADRSMTQSFKNTFTFGGPFEKVGGRGGWEDRPPFVDLANNMDMAFRDVRLFTRLLSAEEAAAYAAAFPVAAAAVSSISSYTFRHDFTKGKLASEGDGYSDSVSRPMIGTGTAVSDPNGYGTATFPDQTGYGTIGGGLNRDWTVAMTLRPGTVASGYGVLCSLGGVNSGAKISVVIASTSQPGELRLGIAQNWGGGKNWPTRNAVTLTGLGDTVNDFHTLVLVHARNLKSNDINNAHQTWATGVFSIYWDGEWKGFLSTSDPTTAGRTLADCIRYGSIWDEIPASDYHALTEASCGAAFRDLRFTPGVWTSQEAQAYTKASGPLRDYLFRYDFTSGSKVYSHIGHPIEPTAEWSGFTAVNGPSGYGTAVHPCGVGTITGGETILNEGDWSVAMCVKPGRVDRGVFLSIGSGRCQQNSRDLCFLSSSTAGKIVLSSRQTWGGQYYNEPSVFEVTGLGDTANTFHTIVATCSAYNKEKDCATVTVYVDGVLKGTFDADRNMTQSFKNTFTFGGPFEKVGGRGGWEDRPPFVDLSGMMDTAFRDVRLFTRLLSAEEAAAYAAAFPVAAATVSSIDDFHFRHNFEKGRLVVEGEGFTDAGLAGTGVRVMGAEGVAPSAAFPDKTGYGTVVGGLNCDWTVAMSVKAPVVGSGENGLLFSLGGIEANGKKAFAVSATDAATGGLFLSVPQRWGSSETEINTCNVRATLANLGDTTGEFHTLVIVHARNQKNSSAVWQTGTFSFYWDGVLAGTIISSDSHERSFSDHIRYGAIYNRLPFGNASHYTPTYVEPAQASGLAFQDLRFVKKIWTSAEAAAYAARYPVARQAKVPGFIISVH